MPSRYANRTQPINTHIPHSLSLCTPTGHPPPTLGFNSAACRILAPTLPSLPPTVSSPEEVGSSSSISAAERGGNAVREEGDWEGGLVEGSGE